MLFAQQRGIKINVKTQTGEIINLYSNSYALVVGVSDYTNGWPDLPNAVNDALDIKNVLEEQGFIVTLLQNPMSSRLKSAIEDFNAKRGLNSGNRLLFYFAGHGHTVKRSYGGSMGYIVPADAPLPTQNRSGFQLKAVSMESFNTYARNVDAKHVLYLFDSCFSGNIFALSRAVPEVINYKTSRPVRQFISAGSEDEQVPDRSIFKSQFVSALRGDGDKDGDGYVTGTELGMFLQDKVVNYSRGAQHPQYGKIRDPQLDRGDFVFILPGKRSTPPPVQQNIDVQTPSSGELDLSRYEKQARELETAKKQWAAWQTNMQNSYDKIIELEDNPELPPSSKSQMWQDFFNNYGSSNI